MTKTAKKTAKAAPVQAETAKSTGKKKVKASPSALAAEAFLIKRFDEITVMALKELLSRAAQDPDGYLIKTIEDKLNDEEPEEKERAFPFHPLDDDELQVGPEFIRKAVKAIGKNFVVSTWVVNIDSKEVPPMAVYRKAFEIAGFEVDWEFNSYRAMSWLEHHGFKSSKKS